MLVQKQRVVYNFDAMISPTTVYSISSMAGWMCRVREWLMTTVGKTKNVAMGGGGKFTLICSVVSIDCTVACGNMLSFDAFDRSDEKDDLPHTAEGKGPILKQKTRSNFRNRPTDPPDFFHWRATKQFILLA